MRTSRANGYGTVPLNPGPGNRANVMSAAIEPGNAAAETEPATIGIGALRVGMHIVESVYDESGVLLLAAGAEVTPRFLDHLRRRGIQCLRLEPSPPTDTAQPRKRRHPQRRKHRFAHREAGREDVQPPPAATQTDRTPSAQRLSLPDLREAARNGLKKHVATSGLVAGICRALSRQRSVSGEHLKNALSDFQDTLALDAALLPLIVSMQRTTGEYLFDHCVNVALVSMSIASRLELDREQLLEVGLGALVHDVGMLRVPDAIRLAPRGLTEPEWAEVRRHPYHTAQYLEYIDGLPETARHISHQVHERADASGYPRRRSALLIHPYARIASIADAYVAMTKPRPYRSAILPYLAVKTLLVEGNDDKFDRNVMRGFLEAVSLFPIGSRVELDDGVQAVVIRSSTELHTQPVVEAVDEQGRPNGELIDLARTSARRVTRAIPDATDGFTPIHVDAVPDHPRRA